MLWRIMRGVITVDLVSHDASDLKCVNAARVSYGTHHEHLTAGDEKLLSAMVREGHGSVFEHSTFTFRIVVPIVAERQWLRHRAGHSYNEISGRYVELPEEWYVPRPRSQSGKAMAYEYAPLDEGESYDVRCFIEQSYARSFADYHALLERGVAKEVARYVLPLGSMTQLYWTCNARSCMHFLSLRAESHAQEEIREAAGMIEDHFRDVMPVTAFAFQEHGRRAP